MFGTKALGAFLGGADWGTLDAVEFTAATIVQPPPPPTTVGP
jgi:hypothetical protein